MTRDIVAKNTIPSCHQLWQVAVLLLSWHCMLVLNGLAAIEFSFPPPISHGLGMYWPSKKKVNAFSYFIFILVILLVSFD
jgi:hypothetical protein